MINEAVYLTGEVSQAADTKPVPTKPMKKLAWKHNAQYRLTEPRKGPGRVRKELQRRQEVLAMSTAKQSEYPEEYTG